MASKENDLIIKVKVVDDFTSKFEKITSAVKLSSFGKLGDNLKSMGGWITTRVTAPLALVAGLSLKAASGVEDLTDAVELFTKSAEETDKVLKDIEGLSINKVFKISEVEGVAQKLLRAGVSTKDLAKNMENLGQISIGAKMPLEELSTIYATVMHRQQLTTRALVMMGRSGIPVTETIAKMANTSKAHIMELAKKGQLGANILDEAFKKMTSSGERFYDQVNKNAKDLAAIYSQLLNSLNKILRAIGKIIGEVVKQVGPDIIKKLNDFADWITKFANEYPNVTKMAMGITALVAGLGALALALAPLITSLTGLVLIFKSGILIQLARMVATFTGLTLLTNPIVLFAGAVTALVVAIDKLFPKLKFIETLGAGVRGITRVSKSAFDFMMGNNKERGMDSFTETVNSIRRRSGTYMGANIPLTSIQDKTPMIYPLNVPNMGINNKGQTDVNIMLSMPDGLKGTVTDVKKRGSNSKVDIMTESYLGSNFRMAGVN